MLPNLLVFTATFFVMEAVAWSMHKYLMHGPLWFLHASHHDDEPGLERNDAFALFFSLSAATLIIGGAEGHIPFGVALGFGMTAYGVAYFALHDVLVHGRLVRVPYPKSAYLRRIIRAHRLHHATNGEHGAHGFLWAPPGSDKLRKGA